MTNSVYLAPVMKKATILFLLLFTLSQGKAQVKPAPADNVLAMFMGNFTDDYGIRYTITDKVWQQLPRTKFHIIKWDVVQQFILAKNDSANPGEGGLYTRIDYMRFNNMEPWKWGFCLTVYDAKTEAAALAITAADRANPRKGCNGFPFSRMKMVE